MCRKGKELSLRDRYFIEKSLNRKMSVKEISEVLGVTSACIYYEIKKGTVTQRDWLLEERQVYKADYAQTVTDRCKSNRGRKLKYSADSEILKNIAICLKNKYSPYASIQICDVSDQICEKTIYNYVRKGNISGITYRNLPYMKKCKKPKHRVGKISIPKEYSIEARPQCVTTRQLFGNWEMDTVYSARDNLSALLVLTERKYRMEIMFKINSRTSKEVLRQFKVLETKLGVKSFRKIFKTITSDNGVEFKCYSDIERCSKSKQKRTKLYYAHPYCSGERGSNENQNRMIRRWIPKGDDIGLYSRDDIASINEWINSYPRKIFGGKSSIEFALDDLVLSDFSQTELQKLCELCNCDYTKFTNLA